MIAIPATDGQFLSEAELERLIAQYGDGLLRVCLLYLKGLRLRGGRRTGNLPARVQELFVL